MQVLFKQSDAILKYRHAPGFDVETNRSNGIYAIYKVRLVVVCAHT